MKRNRISSVFQPKMERTVARFYMHEMSEAFRLTFLLTGDQAVSVAVAMEGLDLNDAANPFFQNWMAAWARKLVIDKALGAVRAELEASRLRTETRHFEYSTGLERFPPLDWRLDPATDKVQLDRALLAVDIFPRCALLLLVFENMPLEDAVVLLDADRELLATAKAIGLIDLVRNLAREQDQVPAPVPYGHGPEIFADLQLGNPC